MRLRFLTAGESHGPALTVIVEGLPAGLPVDARAIDRELLRRMGGYGRGGRMQIERDGVEILGGLRFSRTLGSPVALLVRNLDHANWLEAMATGGERPDHDRARAVTRPRPGHADLAGALKFRTHDARDVFERSSARETAARVAAGALAKSLLGALGVDVTSRTVAVGTVVAPETDAERFDDLLALPDDAPMRAVDAATRDALVGAVEEARRRSDSVGGVFEVLARNVPPGLGSHTHWDRRLDGLLAWGLMSIQAVKGVEIGDGVGGAARYGSEQHDEIGYDAAARRFVRATNRAGGIEGGISNGETIRARAWLKPLATLPRPLGSIDLVTKQPFAATRERTDTIPIVAAGVVGEAMVAWTLADELLVKFGGDRLDDTLDALRAYRGALERY